MSDEEILFVSGKDDLEDGIKDLWCDGWRALVVTYGPKGSRFITPEFDGFVPSYKITAVDATGAGDGCTAGFLSRLLKDPALLGSEEKLRAACAFANAVGAITATKRGAINALPTEKEVEDFLSAR